MAKCESAFEERNAKHNGIADSRAVCRSDDRPCRFTQLYFAMFQQDKASKRTSASILIESSDEESESRLYSFLDTLSTDMDPAHFVQNLGYPVEFPQSLLELASSS